MRGRDFLDPARDAATTGKEPYLRSGYVDAYYALFLECRDRLTAWGFTIPRFNVHGEVRQRYRGPTHADLNRIADALDVLGQFRNRASYNLAAHTIFATDVWLRNAIQRAEDAIALLDAIEADPARRAAAIASIRP
jgi:hypothetical protein